MTDQIIPIINQLYWRCAGGEYQLIRQTQASETVFFIATQAEYFAIQHQGQAAKIAELEAALADEKHQLELWKQSFDEVFEENNETHRNMLKLAAQYLNHPDVLAENT